MSELETIHLVDALTEHDDLYTAFYCTYGADLAFFEEVLLHPLRNKNVRQHVIFMDAARYNDTVQHLRGSVSWVGRRYLVVPVHMPPFTAFHPKLVLLAGKKRGRLLVGSGNLTFTGFGHNRELYTCLDWNPDQTGQQRSFTAAWQFLRMVQEQHSESALIAEIFRKTEFAAPWLDSAGEDGEVDEPVSLEFLHSLRTPILEQLTQLLATETVKQITIVTPFLDRNLVALRKLFQQFNPEKVRLVLQENQAVGDPEALQSLMRDGLPLELYRFGEEERYLHAKLLIFETDAQAFALTGSPNCTYAGLVGHANRGRGNVEIALLRRGDTPDHFDYLLPDVFRAENTASAEQLGLRLERLPASEPGTSDDAEEGGYVRLLEAALSGNELSLRLQLLETLPPDVAHLQIQFSTTPQESVRAPIPSNDSLSISLELPDLLLDVLRWEAALSVTVQGLDESQASVELGCNELWLARVDDLRAAARSSHHGSVRASSFLAEMVAESDSDWRDLYQEIQRLVDLDVTHVSQQRSSPATGTARRKGEANTRGERETAITIASEDSLDVEEEEALAATMAREGELQSFLDYVHSTFPGSARAATGNGNPPTDQSDEGSQRRRKKWPPKRRVRVRFLNLIKKYVRSLHNPDYMQKVRIPDALAYYVIFQRIIWLLHENSNSSNDSGYIELALSANEGFFGAELYRAPVLSPCLQRHLRFVWADDWMSHEAPLYALVTLNKMKQLARTEESDELTERLHASAVRVVACLYVTTKMPALLEQIEALLPLQSVAHTFDEQPEELALRLPELLGTHTKDAILALTAWKQQAVFDPEEITDAGRARLLYQANVDYRRALYHLFETRGETDKQISEARELSFWCRRVGARIEADIWHERLIELYLKDGQNAQVVKELYNLAHRQFVAQDYEKAQHSVEKARALAGELGDDQVIKKCERLAANIRYLAR